MSDKAPETVLLAPNGGLPTGIWPKELLVKYRRADLPATDAQAMQNEKVKALVKAVDRSLNPEGKSRLYRHLVERKLRTALAQLKEGQKDV